MATADPFDLERFVTAQAPVFNTALTELKAGRKRSHWMWFIFPQLRGLGHSSTAQFYGIGSLDEAQAYLEHALLGPRLTLCTETVLVSNVTSVHELFGSPDDLKFRSSMTLFALAVKDDGSLFRKVLDRWCEGQMDGQTQRLLLSHNVRD
jgi:uncharacterized protein (DUF1810 family)